MNRTKTMDSSNGYESMWWGYKKIGGLRFINRSTWIEMKQETQDWAKKRDKINNRGNGSWRPRRCSPRCVIRLGWMENPFEKGKYFSHHFEYRHSWQIEREKSKVYPTFDFHFINFFEFSELFSIVQSRVSLQQSIELKIWDEVFWDSGAWLWLQYLTSRKAFQ